MCQYTDVPGVRGVARNVLTRGSRVRSVPPFLRAWVDWGMSILAGGATSARTWSDFSSSAEEAVVVDDLSYGTERAQASSSSSTSLQRPGPQTLAEVMDSHGAAVIHLAARKQVGESVERPAWY